MQYFYLSLAIVSEVIATSALNASQGLTKPWPVALMTITYAIAFIFLALTLKSMPVGIAYAIWSGAGIVLIAGVGWFLYRQSLDAAAMAGMAMIIVGICIMKLFSSSARL